MAPSVPRLSEGSEDRLQCPQGWSFLQAKALPLRIPLPGRFPLQGSFRSPCSVAFFHHQSCLHCPLYCWSGAGPQTPRHVEGMERKQCQFPVGAFSIGRLEKSNTAMPVCSPLPSSTCHTALTLPNSVFLSHPLPSPFSPYSSHPGHYQMAWGPLFLILFWRNRIS